jgi:hypothetical protein
MNVKYDRKIKVYRGGNAAPVDKWGYVPGITDAAPAMELAASDIPAKIVKNISTSSVGYTSGAKGEKYDGTAKLKCPYSYLSVIQKGDIIDMEYKVISEGKQANGYCFWQLVNLK